MKTVTACTFQKEWSKDGRTGKIYDVVFSDDSKGQAFGEIPVGTTESDLEIIPNGNYPAKVKLLKKNGFAGGGFKQKAGNESFAMSYAKDLVVADKVKIDQLIPTAEKIYTWLQSKKQ
jgi:hypothetical protein